MTIFVPNSEEDISEIIKNASQSLTVLGGGTRGFVEPCDNVLKTNGLSGIIDYQPGALTMIAKAGTPLDEINSQLAKQGQQLPFEPADYRAMLGLGDRSTIGGVFAANISGPRRIQVGAARDFLLGVRFVDGRGEILKSGGSVMKNVTGYDLVKLMAGSHGTLGVMTQLAFKVLPVSETEATLVLRAVDDHNAIQILTTAMNSPFDVSGAAHIPAKGETYLRLEGFKKSVRYRTEKLVEYLKTSGAVHILEDQDSKTLWSDIRDVKSFANETLDIWRLSVKLTSAADIVSAVGFEKYQYDWSGGLIWGAIAANKNPRPALSEFGGHATCVKGSSSIPKFQPQTASVARLSNEIRKKFDPRGILNTGLMA